MVNGDWSAARDAKDGNKAGQLKYNMMGSLLLASRTCGEAFRAMLGMNVADKRNRRLAATTGRQRRKRQPEDSFRQEGGKPDRVPAILGATLRGWKANGKKKNVQLKDRAGTCPVGRQGDCKRTDAPETVNLRDKRRLQQRDAEEVAASFVDPISVERGINDSLNVFIDRLSARDFLAIGQ